MEFIDSGKTEQEKREIIIASAKRLGKEPIFSPQAMARAGKVWSRCKKGHELSGDNLGTYVHTGYTERFCKICNKVARRNKTLRKYKMTVEDYERLLEKQNYKCAVCGSTDPGGQGVFHVDHDHKCCDSEKSCGKCTRALLCFSCNSSLGMIGDSSERLVALADYLQSFGPKSFTKAPLILSTLEF